jgi:hypothetical protein
LEQFCVDTEILSNPALTQLWVYTGVWLPWPISQRQTVLRARGYDLLSRDGCVVFTLATPKGGKGLALCARCSRPCPACCRERERETVEGYSEKLGHRPGMRIDTGELPADAAPMPAAAASRADIDLLSSGGTLHQLTESTVRARLLINVNPHMRAVPAWLVSFVLSVMVPWVLSMVIRYMRTTFRDPKSEYTQRLEADRSGLYGHFAARLLEESSKPRERGVAQRSTEAPAGHT